MKVLNRHTLPDVGQAVLGYMSFFFFFFFSIKLDILGNKDEDVIGYHNCNAVRPHGTIASLVNSRKYRKHHR